MDLRIDIFMFKLVYTENFIFCFSYTQTGKSITRIRIGELVILTITIVGYGIQNYVLYYSQAGQNQVYRVWNSNEITGLALSFQTLTRANLRRNVVRWYVNWKSLWQI